MNPFSTALEIKTNHSLLIYGKQWRFGCITMSLSSVIGIIYKSAVSMIQMFVVIASVQCCSKRFCCVHGRRTCEYNAICGLGYMTCQLKSLIFHTLKAGRCILYTHHVLSLTIIIIILDNHIKVCKNRW